MSVLMWIGAGLAALGVAGLGWCIRRAAALRRSDTDPETARAVLRSLVAVNMGSVGLAFLGLALMVAGGLL